MPALTRPEPSAHRRSVAPRAYRGERALLITGVLVAAIVVGLYVAALLHYPRISLLKGFDLGVYRAGGWLARQDPARLYSWQLRPGVQFTYPPFAALVFIPLSLLSLAHAMDLAVALSTTALVATIWIAFRELGLRGPARIGAALLIAGAGFWTQPVQRTLFLGQIELVLMGLVVWDVCQDDARPWKGAVTGLAAGIKLVPLIFIAYLLVTRRFRQAALAVAAFAATIAVGFAALPGDSVKWWLHGYFFKADRTGFVGRSNNQSLLGTITRFAGSAHAGKPVWVVVAVVIGLLGLGTAALLQRTGRGFEGLMVCALTALLISPISWDAHWVWVAPGLAALTGAALTSDRHGLRVAWALVAALVLAAFGGWPAFWRHGFGPLPAGLIWYAPTTPFGYGDNPAFVEYHWHGIQVLVGNLYVLFGCVLLLLALWYVTHAAPRLRTGHARAQTRPVSR